MFVFIALLLVLYVRNRKNIQFQGLMALYRTKLGINFSKKAAGRFPRFFRYFGYLSIILGFVGMIIISYVLVTGGINLLTKPNAQPVVAPVLPFVHIPGLPTLLFTYWIIGIFVVAVIHELSHAFLSSLYGVKVKSSGFAFLGPIPAAFVEPDEKQLAKKKKPEQLAVLAAGSTSNIVTGLVFLIVLLFILTPAVLSVSTFDIRITEVVNNTPADFAGLGKGMLIKEIGGMPAENISRIFETLKPNQKLNIITDKGNFNLVTAENPENKTKGYIGISIEVEAKPKSENSKTSFAILIWVQRLFLWLFVLSLGIALVNLLPLGPIDGGRMFHVVLGYITEDEKKKNFIFKSVTLISLFFIILNLSPYIIRFFNWLIGLGA